MKYSQRRSELIAGLEATANIVVTLNVNHVAEVLGIEAAEELHNPGTLTHTTEAVRIKRAGDGTRAVAKTLQGGLAEWDREKLLEALKASPEEQPMQATSQQETKQTQETNQTQEAKQTQEVQEVKRRWKPGELNQSTQAANPKTNLES